MPIAGGGLRGAELPLISLSNLLLFGLMDSLYFKFFPLSILKVSTHRRTRQFGDRPRISVETNFRLSVDSPRTISIKVSPHCRPDSWRMVHRQSFPLSRWSVDGPRIIWTIKIPASAVGLTFIKKILEIHNSY